jgi:hypothetical protein
VPAIQHNPRHYACRGRAADHSANIGSRRPRLGPLIKLCAFDVLAIDGDDVRDLPLSMRKVHLDRLLRSRPDGIFINPFETGDIGPDLFRAACDMGLEGLVRNEAIGHIAAEDRPIGLR